MNLTRETRDKKINKRVDKGEKKEEKKHTM